MSRSGTVVSTAPIEIDGDHAIAVKTDLGGGEIAEPEQYLPPGVDARPLPDDPVVVGEPSRSGVKHALGYQDGKNEPKAQPGESRMYARDTTGALVCEMWMKGDGTVHLKVLTTAPLHLEAEGPIIIESGDVRLGSAPGKQVACVGDIVTGSVRALSSAPGSPIVPAAGLPTPTGGVTFVGKIASGRPSVKA